MPHDLNPTDYYRAQRAPYYIVAPDFHEASSGIRVLHYLCHILNSRGLEAYIHSGKVNPALWTPALTDEIMEAHYLAARKPIVVYPEIVSGTPLGMGIKVRYMLNKPGFIAGHDDYDGDELFFAYIKGFLPEGVPEHILCIPASDPGRFNPHGTAPEQRQGRYFFYNRLLTRGGQLQPMTADAIEISPAKPRPLDELADIFRQAELLYCYEASSIATEARLCGCPVVYVPNDTMLPEFPHNPLGDDGTAWSDGEADIARAKATVHRIFEKYMKLYDEFLPQLDHFISLTQQKADETDFGQCYPPETIAARGWRAHMSLASGTTVSPGNTPSTNAATPGNARVQRADAAYEAWLAMREPLPSDGQFIALDDPIPTFHLLLRLAPGEEARLAMTLDALGRQVLGGAWYLDVLTTLPAPAGIDSIPCLSWHTLASGNDGQAAANQCVTLRSLDWIVELPPGGIPDPLYLWRIAITASTSPASAFFVDDDCIEPEGRRHSPRFKPGANHERLVSSDLAGPLCIRRDRWLTAGGAGRDGGSPWYEQLLNLLASDGAGSVAHIPDVLISYAEELPTDTKACLLAALTHHQARGSEIEILPRTPQSWSIRPRLPAGTWATVAILSQGNVDLLSRCVASLKEKTDYTYIELVIVVTERDPDPILAKWLEELPATCPYPLRIERTTASASHAERCNRALAAAGNEHVVLAREEAIFVQGTWLRDLLCAALPADIAAVNPRQLKAGSGLIQSGGCVIGLKDTIGAAYAEEALPTEAGYLDQLRVARDIAALGDGCVLLKRTAWEAAGTFTDRNQDNCFALADFGLRLREAGFRLLFEPAATVVCEDSQRNGAEAEVEETAAQLVRSNAARREFLARWQDAASIDPYWHPNFSLAASAPVLEATYPAPWRQIPNDKPRLFAHSLSNGQGVFRVIAPLRAARKHGLAMESIWLQHGERQPSPAELQRLAPATAIVQHYIYDRHLASLRAWRDTPGHPFIVYTIDDLITDIDPTNPFYKNLPPNGRSRIRYALSHCDRLVTSTPFLADQFSAFIRDIQIVPNCLDPDIWLPLTTERRTGKRPRVGWAGGETHLRDLLVIKAVVEKTHHEIDWVFFGMCPDEIRPHVAEFHPLSKFSTYPARLASLNLDLAVAPLAQIPFNRAKSNLRLLEYGILGIPVVCTDIDSYRGSPACCVSNDPDAWIEAIRSRIHEPEALAREGEAMAAWVKANFLLTPDHLRSWLAAYLPTK